MNRIASALLLTCSIAVTLLMSNCREIAPFQVEKGVSKKLNDLRKANLSKLAYELSFNIPLQQEDPIAGNVAISFEMARVSRPLVVDFQASAEQVQQVSSGGKIVDYRFENGHILIPEKYLSAGVNRIEIAFTAGDQSLNRNEDYLYTLFVPDRASTAFPCFDQPNLKATCLLTLEVHREWTVVANGVMSQKQEKGERTVYRFERTPPISSYLIAFAAGKFQAVERQRNGRNLTFYHRETDGAKIAANLDEVFDLHFEALDWMEEYTAIPLPFAKFDFVAIPSFQYGGMEHPGAVLYRSEKLFLDPTATQEDLLDRATLIAHETAHMWFGDLVTMAWFDDVWLKEVFANFMASRIVHPAFPGIDHEQSFLIDHYPKAYEVDRTAGANAIKQELENMNQAGTLYGSIIYHKAPIVMRQLEQITGAEKLQEGLRQYLRDFSYANADWNDLVAILDSFTETDLVSWSRVWVSEAGMPAYELSLEGGKAAVVQTDPQGMNRVWPQQLHLYLIRGSETSERSLFVTGAKTALADSLPADLVLLNGRGYGYGYFKLDEATADRVTSDWIFSLPPGTRTIIYLSLWENMLHNNLDVLLLADGFLTYLEMETDELNINLLLNYYRTFFWIYADKALRQYLVKKVENLLWDKLNSAGDASLQATYFRAYQATALSEKGRNNLYDLWNGELKIKGLDLSEDDLTTLAFELAVRQRQGDDPITDHLLEYQLGSIKNPDKRKRMNFILPALSLEEATRDAFFESLKDPANREHEPWVLTALQYLHHPLRAESAEKYVLPSLEILEEIQVTGDIFFPKGWLDATLGGYRSRTAANRVRIYLNNNPDLDPKLRQKVLQSADPLFRAAAMSGK